MAVQWDVIEDGSNQDVENFIYLKKKKKRLTELDSVGLGEERPLTMLCRNSRHTHMRSFRPV